MNKDYSNVFILNSLDLPIVKDLDTLSNAIGISKKMLYLLSKEPEKYYKSFLIDKDSEGSRKINSPNLSMKLVQKWILEEVLYKITPTEEAMAFKKGINGIKQNASFHRYSLYFLQVDIKDFFPSITRKRVYLLFKNMGYSKNISHIFAKICTYNNKLPQGGVCSPHISNLICIKLDRRLKGLCSKRDILYTRYADDMTFSGDNKEVLRKTKNIITKIIRDEGFELNNNKTRYLSPVSHKKITGVTIDSHNNLKADKTIKKKVRAMIHKTIVTGDYSDSDIIKGLVSFITSIEKDFYEKQIEYIEKLITKYPKYFSSSVNSFNRNKLYRELTDMEHEVFQDEFHPYSSDGNLGYYEQREYENQIQEMIDSEIQMIKNRKEILDKHNVHDEELEQQVKQITNSEAASSLSYSPDDDLPF